MCLLIAIVVLAASYNFYEQGFVLQAVMSATFALFMFGFFIYRIIKIKMR